MIVSYTKFVSVKTQLWLGNRVCVYKSHMFRPRVGHSEAHNNSKKKFIEEDNIKVVVWLNIVK